MKKSDVLQQFRLVEKKEEKRTFASVDMDMPD
jgi:hypothetical protein